MPNAWQPYHHLMSSMELESVPRVVNCNGSDVQRRQRFVTIIIAATQSMGMSFKRHLPWPKLPREQSYFESTTTRAPTPKTMNAIIIGYNTWDKEPSRPIRRYPDRINVVITRQPEAAWVRLRNDHREGIVHIATSISEAVDLLERIYPYPNEDDKHFLNGFPSHANGNGAPPQGDEASKNDLPYLGRIFVIGGAGLCREALKIPSVNRLLLTRVMVDCKSDTFFPLFLDGKGNHEWRRQTDESFREWGGLEIPIGLQRENGIEWEAYMFERA